MASTIATPITDMFKNKLFALGECVTDGYKEIVSQIQDNFIPKKKIPVIISIEGNIGSGKSTLLKHLKEFYNPENQAKNCKNPSICFLDEPVELWNTIKDSNGITILEKYYDNIEKYAFAFQMMAYISRLSIFRKALQGNYDVIITERSMYTDFHVFAQMLYDDKKIEEIEFVIYKKWFDEFIEELPKINYIYIKTDPDIAHQRVLKRSRQGETIPLDYLDKCHAYHEKWLKTVDGNKRIFDANCDITNDMEILDNWLERINYYINVLLGAMPSNTACVRN
jgi:deoxyadenosine/deoxycytidine kinase